MILRKIFVLFLIVCGSLKGYSTVKGPLIIDIIGYEEQSNKLYFTRTDWAECDCETDLFIYHIDSDSLEIIRNWSSRLTFKLHKEKVLAEKGFNAVRPLEKRDIDSVWFNFKWLPKIDYYSPVTFTYRFKCPFVLTVADKDYKFIQCFSQDKMPLIHEYYVNGMIRLLHTRYFGDCYEGNTNDELILTRKTSSGLKSVLLITSARKQMTEN